MHCKQLSARELTRDDVTCDVGLKLREPRVVDEDALGPMEPPEDVDHHFGELQRMVEARAGDDVVEAHSLADDVEVEESGGYDVEIQIAHDPSDFPDGVVTHWPDNGAEKQEKDQMRRRIGSTANFKCQR